MSPQLPHDTVRVLVVDDQPVVRAGFAAIIDDEPDLTVVGEAGDGASAVVLAGQLTPDVVLMDIRMPEMDGLTATGLLTRAKAEATARAKAEARTGATTEARTEATTEADPPSRAAPRVLVLTTFDLDSYVYEALRAGASGFLLKDAQPAELLAAIRIVAAGEAMLAPAVTHRLIAAFAGGGAPATPGAPATSGALDTLTPREREVLSLVATGLSNAEIAHRLHVTTGTVKTHVNALLNKLGVRDRVQATIFAYDTGLVRPKPPHGHGPAHHVPPARR